MRTDVASHLWYKAVCQSSGGKERESAEVKLRRKWRRGKRGECSAITLRSTIVIVDIASPAINTARWVVGAGRSRGRRSDRVILPRKKTAEQKGDV